MTGWGFASLHRARWLLVVVCGIGALGLAACGSDSDDSDQAGAATAAEGSDFSEKDAAVVREFVGGGEGKADASATPYRIGFVNQEGGLFNGEGMTVAARTAVEVVNKHLGGIDGRPVELDVCRVVSSAQQAQLCGQRFANDREMNVVVEGYLQLGSDAFHEALGQSKPVIGTLPNPATELDLPGAFYTASSSTANGPDYSFVVTDVLEVTGTAVVVHENDPVVTALMEPIKTSLTEAGIEVRTAAYPPNATNLVAPLTAGGVRDADVIITIPTQPAQCISLAEALDQVGADVTVLSGAVCSDPSVGDALGDLPPWIFGARYPSLEQPPAALKPQVDAYLNAMRRYGDYALRNSLFSPLGFGAVVDTVKFINDAGGADAKPQAIVSELEQFKGPLWIQPVSEWGNEPTPSVGNGGLWFYRYEGDGKLSDVPGEWVTPDGLVPVE